MEQKGTFTTAGLEEVEVPAGKFKALRVELEVKEQSGRAVAAPQRVRYWFAAGVGLVKMEVVGMKEPNTRLLKSFTTPRGKK